MTPLKYVHRLELQNEIDTLKQGAQNNFTRIYPGEIHFNFVINFCVRKIIL